VVGSVSYQAECEQDDWKDLPVNLRLEIDEPENGRQRGAPVVRVYGPGLNNSIGVVKDTTANKFRCRRRRWQVTGHEAACESLTLVQLVEQSSHKVRMGVTPLPRLTQLLFLL
jgi:hypothetical protein